MGIFDDAFQTQGPDTGVALAAMSRALQAKQQALDPTKFLESLDKGAKVLTDMEDRQRKANTANLRRMLASIPPEVMEELLRKGIDPIEYIQNSWAPIDVADKDLNTAWDNQVQAVKNYETANFLQQTADMTPDQVKARIEGGLDYYANASPWVNRDNEYVRKLADTQRQAVQNAETAKFMEQQALLSDADVLANMENGKSYLDGANSFVNLKDTALIQQAKDRQAAAVNYATEQERIRRMQMNHSALEDEYNKRQGISLNSKYADLGKIRSAYEKQLDQVKQANTAIARQTELMKSPEQRQRELEEGRNILAENRDNLIDIDKLSESTKENTKQSIREQTAAIIRKMNAMGNSQQKDLTEQGGNLDSITKNARFGDTSAEGVTKGFGEVTKHTKDTETKRAVNYIKSLPNSEKAKLVKNGADVAGFFGELGDASSWDATDLVSEYRARATAEAQRRMRLVTPEQFKKDIAEGRDPFGQILQQEYLIHNDEDLQKAIKAREAWFENNITAEVREKIKNMPIDQIEKWMKGEIDPIGSLNNIVSYANTEAALDAGRSGALTARAKGISADILNQSNPDYEKNGPGYSQAIKKGLETGYAAVVNAMNQQDYTNRDNTVSAAATADAQAKYNFATDKEKADGSALRRNTNSWAVNADKLLPDQLNSIDSESTRIANRDGFSARKNNPSNKIEEKASDKDIARAKEEAKQNVLAYIAKMDSSGSRDWLGKTKHQKVEEAYDALKVIDPRERLTPQEIDKLDLKSSSENYAQTHVYNTEHLRGNPNAYLEEVKTVRLGPDSAAREKIIKNDFNTYEGPEIIKHLIGKEKFAELSDSKLNIAQIKGYQKNALETLAKRYNKQGKSLASEDYTWSEEAIIENFKKYVTGKEDIAELERETANQLAGIRRMTLKDAITTKQVQSMTDIDQADSLVNFQTPDQHIKVLKELLDYAPALRKQYENASAKAKNRVLSEIAYRLGFRSSKEINSDKFLEKFLKLDKSAFSQILNQGLEKACETIINGTQAEYIENAQKLKDIASGKVNTSNTPNTSNTSK